MKESYEGLEMEVIAFDGDIFTDDADGVVVSGSHHPYAGYN